MEQDPCHEEKLPKGMPLAFELEPDLVHRILLTDASDMDALRRNTPNVTFEEFGENVHQGNDAVFVMKKAFRDHIRDSWESKQDVWPLLKLLLECHEAIRSLVPNRPDLHSMLQDPSLEDVSACDWDWKDQICQAAKALSQLESEDKAKTTREWIRRCTTRTAAPQQEDATFVITSLLYLIEKCELCKTEKEDFYITQVVAPKLKAGDGFDVDRRFFQERFPMSPPVTREWIHKLVANLDQSKKESIQNVSKERCFLVISGWIQSILFETQHKLVLPEIFMLDLEQLREIRKTTRAAAAGCALGWHACQAARRPSTDTVLQQEHEGLSLVETMNNGARFTSQELYEQSVEDSVLVLAQKWNEGRPLEPSVVELLRGQTRAVLRGQDPVLKLLDARMKDLFVKLACAASSGNDGAPASMQTGIAAAASSSSSISWGDSFPAEFSRQEFCKGGLAFYAQDLALAAHRAFKIGSLAFTLYSNMFLDQMILDALSSAIISG